MSSASLKLLRLSLSIFIPMLSQSNFPNTSPKQAVNTFGDIVSPCLTSLLTGFFFSLSCRVYFSSADYIIMISNSFMNGSSTPCLLRACITAEVFTIKILLVIFESRLSGILVLGLFSTT